MKKGAEAPFFISAYWHHIEPESLERQKSLELSTYTLARYRSTN